jgi:ACS family pantothenate transporter-like MFS transporter
MTISIESLSRSDVDEERIELTELQENATWNRQDEIELVHRLDKRLLLFTMFGNLVKVLDNTNLGTKPKLTCTVVFRYS